MSHLPSNDRRKSFVLPLAAHSGLSVPLPQLADLQLLLQSTSADCLIPANRQLFSISIDASLSHAAHLLARHKILAAPVLNDDSTCAGVIDSLTIVDFLLAQVHPANKQKNSANTDEIGKTPLKTVLASSNRTALKAFFQKNPLSLLMELFGTGVHRCALITEAYEILNICSQSDLIIHLANLLQNHNLTQLANVPVKNLPLTKRSLVSLTQDSTVKDCLISMKKNHVNSLAIVNDEQNKQLKAEFSASDLRGVSDFRDIHLPVIQFLEKYHPLSLHPLTINEETSLIRVIQALSEHRMKRAWIVDSRYAVQDLVSSTDLCNVLSLDKHQSLTERELNGNVSYGQLWRSEPTKVHAIESEPEIFEFSSEP
jgi:CBS-domain-containing membrane protein